MINFNKSRTGLILLMLFLTTLVYSLNLADITDENAAVSENETNSSVETQNTQAESTVVPMGKVDSSIKALNFRDAPWGNIIGVIPAGAEVEILGDSDNPNWIKVKYQEKEGFVYKSYIEITQSQVPVDEVVATQGKIQGCSWLNVRKSEWGPIVGGLGLGASVKILRTRNNWHEIEFKNGKAWVSAKYVKSNGSANNTKPPVVEPPIVEPPVTNTEPEKPKPDINVNGFEQIIKDPKTGYRLWVKAPEKYDGSVELYFPGDGSGIEKVLEQKFLLNSAQKKWNNGGKSAVVIVEGRKASITADKSNRYSALSIKGMFTSMVDTLTTALQRVDKIHLLAHSRGGGAIFWIMHKAEYSEKIKMVSCMDSTYWAMDNLIALAKRGGKVNVCYKLWSPTDKRVDALLKQTKFTKVDVLSGFEKEKTHYSGIQGNIHIHANTWTHRENPSIYSEHFMKTFTN